MVVLHEYTGKKICLWNSLAHCERLQCFSMNNKHKLSTKYCKRFQRAFISTGIVRFVRLQDIYSIDVLLTLIMATEFVSCGMNGDRIKLPCCCEVRPKIMELLGKLGRHCERIHSVQFKLHLIEMLLSGSCNLVLLVSGGSWSFFEPKYIYL